jgi:invasion protein IalB
MKVGQRATFTFFDGAAHKVAIPLSLEGFASGFEKLAAGK